LNSFEMTLLKRQGLSNKEIAEKAGVTEEEVASSLKAYNRFVQGANTPAAIYQFLRDKQRGQRKEKL